VIKLSDISKVFPARRWNKQECEDFEAFVKENAPELNRVFTKFAVMKTNRA